MSALHPQAARRIGSAAMAEVFRGNQVEAEREMARAGVRPPRPCACENPAIHTDLDGDTSCLLCGRRPR